MNSIRRPRRRCRVKSVNFRVFGWLLIHEAMLAIEGPCYYRDSERASRQFFCKIPSYELQALYHATAPHEGRKVWS